MEKRATAATEKHVGERARSGAKVAAVKAVSVKRPATEKRKPATGKRKPAAGAKLRTVAFKGIAPAALYRATGLERVQMIREGVPAIVLEKIVRKMDIPKERLYATLRLPRSTVDRKIRNKDTLSAEHSERVIGLERLIGQVEVMVAQSGNPEGFDADRWVGEWLERPLPALGGAKPADFMDTMEGQELVSRLLAQSQSGAYA
jgi:putative toxin-antitoxin system antitoxin component (TIGR02293 family)